MASKRILVTGGLGTVGAGLVTELRSRGHHVVSCDLHHQPDEIGFSLRTDVEVPLYARCDVGEFRQIERVFERCGPFDYVYHCAAEFGRWNGEDFYETLWRTNAVGTKNVIRLQERARLPPDPLLVVRGLRRLAGADGRDGHGRARDQAAERLRHDQVGQRDADPQRHAAVRHRDGRRAPLQHLRPGRVLQPLPLGELPLPLLRAQ